jgi:DNA invertase Pin-like site-specific DNA recombinase
MPLSRLAPIKIRPDHLDRQAIIYVRQSTLLQVREHTGSTARQYDLVPRALDLGWPRERIHIIDQDQGRSGASAATRDGFQWLVAEVGLNTRVQCSAWKRRAWRDPVVTGIACWRFAP